MKVTYLSPNISGFQAGLSIAYATDGPYGTDNQGTLGIGLGAKYAGSGGGVDYAVSLVWGDRTIYANGEDPKDGYGGLGLGVKVGGAGVTGVLGVTIDGLGLTADVVDANGNVIAADFGLDPIIYLSPGVAYAIPGGKANVSVTSTVLLARLLVNTEVAGYLSWLAPTTLSCPVSRLRLTSATGAMLLTLMTRPRRVASRA